MSSPPGKRRGRPVGAASTDSTPIKSDSIVPPNPLAEMSIGRRTWARRYLEQQSRNRPTYGSTRWLMLDDADPDKWAAVVAAAECWADAGDTLEDDLRHEIAELRAGFKHGEDEEYQRAAEAHRAHYKRAHGGRSFMDRRADQLEAAKPRPDDYKGGPVEWNGGDAS